MLGGSSNQEWRSFTPRPSRRAASSGSAQLAPGKKTVRFTEIGVQKQRWDLFGASAGMQLAFVGALIWVPIIMLRAQPPSLKYEAHLLAAPAVLEYKPPPPPQQKFMKPVAVPQPKIVEQPKIEPLKPRVVFQPRIAQPQVKPQQVAKIEAPNVFADAAPAKLDLVAERPGPQRPLPPVKTGMLEGTGSSATPTLTNRRIEQVQTGGFGDPNGVPASANKTGKPGNINARGSFDLPTGPGYGNGTGGANGARGTVASAGFGNGVATAGSGTGRGGSGRGVQSTSFGDVQPVTGGGDAVKPKAAIGNPVRTPVEIIAKPNPDFTAEAKAKRIEGDVLLEVVFRANGTLDVVRMLRGLGHGLDDNALAAARKIRFRPARENGQPVDQPARVTIEFKLAY